MCVLLRDVTESEREGSARARGRVDYTHDGDGKALSGTERERSHGII
jgi:hypothetical protein